MIKIKYEIDYTDFKQFNNEKYFNNLQELKDWIFEQMAQPYINESTIPMSFPKKEPSAIMFKPKTLGPLYYIYQINNDNEIWFSDGTFTNGQKHWNQQVKNWITECIEFQNNPTFNFK